MQTINLNGLWDFVIDLDPKYHDDRTIGRDACYARPNWDRRHWQKVPVPGVWNKYSERLDIYEGVCWFAREFSVPSLPSGATSLLRFGGVNYRCRIFLNGKEVGGHEGGYTEFVVDVSEHIRQGTNLLAAQVDNRATSTRLPPCLGYFNYGGIHRDVTLEIHSGAFVRNAFVVASPSLHGGHIRVRGEVAKPKAGLKVRVTCCRDKAVATVDDRNAFNLDLSVSDVRPWSPDTPALYPVSLQLLDGSIVLHELSYDVGFRRIEIAGGKIALNGAPIFLKGVCYVYDSPVYGLSLEPEQFLGDIALFRELGVNTIRSHFPFTREFYEACDRAGIMVWIEPPIYCIHPKTDATNSVFADPEFRRLANSMVEEMILHARNHPSVIIYGVGNECNTENPEARPFFQELCDTVRRLDSTRLVSYASLYGAIGPLAGMVDIIGVNEYWGWYDRIYGSKGPTPDQRALQTPETVTIEKIDLRKFEQKLDELKRVARKPMLITEFGADSIPGYLSQSHEFWSEDYHAQLLRETFAVIEKHPEICGTFPFGFSDYRDPSKFVNGYWDYMNYKGLVSYERRPKLPFHALKAIYRSRR